MGSQKSVLTVLNDTSSSARVELRRMGGQMLDGKTLRPKEGWELPIDARGRLGRARDKLKSSKEASKRPRAMGDTVILWVGLLRSGRTTPDSTYNCSLLVTGNVRVSVSEIVRRHTAERTAFLKLVRAIRRPHDKAALRLGRRWFESSGAKKNAAAAAASSTSYEDYAQMPRGHLSETVDQIRRDLERTTARTFRDERSREFFSALETSETHARLLRVLVAFSQKYHQLGYTQGLNYLCFILCAVLPEREAFWTLCALVERRLSDFYSKNPASLNGLRIDTDVLVALMDRQWPGLGEFEDQNYFSVRQVLRDILGGQWLVLMFATHMGLESTLVVMDTVLRRQALDAPRPGSFAIAYEVSGDRALFSAALSILERVHEDAIETPKKDLAIGASAPSGDTASDTSRRSSVAGGTDVKLRSPPCIKGDMKEKALSLRPQHVLDGLCRFAPLCRLQSILPLRRDARAAAALRWGSSERLVTEIANFTVFSLETLRRWRGLFALALPQGRHGMDRALFRVSLRRLGFWERAGAGAIAKPARNKMLRRLFQMVDRDQSGQIDFREFVVFLSDMVAPEDLHDNSTMQGAAPRGRVEKMKTARKLSLEMVEGGTDSADAGRAAGSGCDASRGWGALGTNTVLGTKGRDRASRARPDSGVADNDNGWLVENVEGSVNTGGPGTPRGLMRRNRPRKSSADEVASPRRGKIVGAAQRSGYRRSSDTVSIYHGRGFFSLIFRMFDVHGMAYLGPRSVHNMARWMADMCLPAVASDKKVSRSTPATPAKRKQKSRRQVVDIIAGASAGTELPAAEIKHYSSPAGTPRKQSFSMLTSDTRPMVQGARVVEDFEPAVLKGESAAKDATEGMPRPKLSNSSIRSSTVDASRLRRRRLAENNTGAFEAALWRTAGKGNEGRRMAHHSFCRLAAFERKLQEFARRVRVSMRRINELFVYLGKSRTERSQVNVHVRQLTSTRQADWHCIVKMMLKNRTLHTYRTTVVERSTSPNWSADFQFILNYCCPLHHMSLVFELWASDLSQQNPTMVGSARIPLVKFSRAQKQLLTLNVPRVDSESSNSVVTYSPSPQQRAFLLTDVSVAGTLEVKVAFQKEWSAEVRERYHQRERYQETFSKLFGGGTDVVV